MAKRKQGATGSAQPAKATSLRSMFLGSQLSDAEVYASLERELERERAAVHAVMRSVISKASKKVVRLSSGIFGPLSDLEGQLDNSHVAIRRYEQADDKDGQLYFMRVIRDNLELELALAKCLRELRAKVAYADPADYWERKQDAWSHGRGFTREAGEA